MIQAGKNITTVGDMLMKVQVEYLYNAIRNPKPDIQNRINQLRIVKNIDTKQYALLKRQLPYIVCGIFNPPVRRTENFAYISYFMLDIDHIAEKGLDLMSLRKKVEADARVLMSFVSPSEDGLKLLFRLDDRCYDAGVFSLFYKVFASQFSNQYTLEQVIDSRTSDVTRACFMSYDSQVYYNPDAEPVKLTSFIDTSSPSDMFRVKKSMEKAEKEQLDESPETKPTKTDVDSEVIQRVKEILLKTPRKAEKPPAYVPEELNEVMASLTEYITETGLQVKEIISIHYGKKIRCAAGLKEAEVNLFYGKRGFSVVQSPRTGTSAEINQLLADLIEAFLSQY